MKTEFYLVVSKSGSTKTTKGRPNLDWNEISIKLNLTLPDSLFAKPILTAEIAIPQDKVQPQQISVEMQNNIQESIKQHTGLPVRLTLVSEVEKQ